MNETFAENCSDKIRIKRLRISTQIGVPDEERATPQDLCISVEMLPENDFRKLNDSIEHTVDYYQVSLRIKELASEKPRKLIETLVEEVAQMILSEFAVKSVLVDVEKYILDDADHVGVSISRSK